MASVAQLQNLQSVLVRDVVGEKRHVLTVGKSETIDSLMKKLRERNVLQAVVVDDENKSKAVGVVDTIDIVTRMLEVHEYLAKDITQERLSDLLFEGKAFLSTEVAKIFSTNLLQISCDTPLTEILPRFSERALLVAVVNENKELVNVIAQSDIVSYCAMNSQLLGEAANKTLEELFPPSLWQRPVLKADVDVDSCFAALQFIRQHEIHGVPVTDKGGKLVGSFSATDLQPLCESWAFKALSLHIPKYQEMYSLTRPLVTCTLKDSVQAVMTKLSTEGVHRIFVVDNDTQKLLAVLSLTDFIRALHTAKTTD